MTRLNLVPPSELTDQHLFAEFREIKMVPRALQRSVNAAAQRVGLHGAAKLVKEHVPKEFTLGTGHVTFFYDKGAYLRRRYDELRAELRKRGVNFNELSGLDPDGMFSWLDDRFQLDYAPTAEALALVRARIQEKIVLKPSWYRSGTPS